MLYVIISDIFGHFSGAFMIDHNYYCATEIHKARKKSKTAPAWQFSLKHKQAGVFTLTWSNLKHRILLCLNKTCDQLSVFTLNYHLSCVFFPQSSCLVLLLSGFY